MKRLWKLESCFSSVQFKLIKDCNNIIDKIHFTPEDFMKLFQGYQKKLKMHSSDKTIIVTILDNLICCLSAFILKHILPFFPLWFSFVSLSISHVGS